MLISQKVSKLINEDIEKKGWEASWRSAESRGGLTSKVLSEIVLMICKDADPVEVKEDRPEPARVAIYNPLDEDFLTSYDINNNSEPVDYLIPKKSTITVPTIAAKHVKDHLIRKVLEDRQWKHAPVNIKKVEKEVVV